MATTDWTAAEARELRDTIANDFLNSAPGDRDAVESGLLWMAAAMAEAMANGATTEQAAEAASALWDEAARR